MANVRKQLNILEVSSKLKNTLMRVGSLETHPPQESLFRLDQEATGVYLVVKGKVRLSLPDLPKLDRVFPGGSLLGLPSTFTGHAYSLAATTVTAAEVVHIDRHAFLNLMVSQTEFCHEVADILCREVTFIQGVLAERRRTKSLIAA